MDRHKSIFNSFLDIFVLKAEQKEKKALEDEKSKKKVLVGGGTGFIGSELCKNLKRKGYLPVVVSRTAGDSKITYNDLKNLGIPNNTQAVVNLAGQNVLDIFHRWTPTFKTKVRTGKDFYVRYFWILSTVCTYISLSINNTHA